MSDGRMSAREALRITVAANPVMRGAELAAKLGISRARVYQILKEEHLALTPPSRFMQDRRSRTGIREPIFGKYQRVNPTVIGTISELLVAADLMARGYTAFFPLVRTCKLDLVATSHDGTIVLRIEVRSGHRGRDGKIKYSTRPSDQRDHYAIVASGEQIAYEPPLP